MLGAHDVVLVVDELGDHGPAQQDLAAARAHQRGLLRNTRPALESKVREPTARPQRWASPFHAQSQKSPTPAMPDTLRSSKIVLTREAYHQISQVVYG